MPTSLPLELFLFLLIVFVLSDVITEYFKKVTVDLLCGLTDDDQVPALWNKLRRRLYAIAFTSSFFAAGIDFTANILNREPPLTQQMNMTVYLFSIKLAVYTGLLTYAIQGIKLLYNQYLNN
jgi:hypothetical protein